MSDYAGQERRTEPRRCPKCDHPDSWVVDTKPPKRRRECKNPDCKHRWNTVEIIEAA